MQLVQLDGPVHDAIAHLLQGLRAPGRRVTARVRLREVQAPAVFAVRADEVPGGCLPRRSLVQGLRGGDPMMDKCEKDVWIERRRRWLRMYLDNVAMPGGTASLIHNILARSPIGRHALSLRNHGGVVGLDLREALLSAFQRPWEQP